MKVQILTDNCHVTLQNKINEFIKDKLVVDIKIVCGNDSWLTALIIFEEETNE